MHNYHQKTFFIYEEGRWFKQFMAVNIKASTVAGVYIARSISPQAINLPVQARFRLCEAGISISSRYFATVRLEISIPSSSNKLVILLSL